jgi:SPP1 family predicted phage head-tail adaptor
VTRDAFGAEVKSWGTLATVWAKVVAVSGSEQVSRAAGVALTLYEITLRYRDDVDTTLRVLYEGLTLEINAVLTSDDTGAMLLQCQQVVMA